MDTSTIPEYFASAYKRYKEKTYKHVMLLGENADGPVVRYYMPRPWDVGVGMPGKIKRREAFCWIMQGQEPIAHFQITEFNLVRGFTNTKGGFLTDRFLETMDQDALWEIELSAVILEQFWSLWWLKKFLAISPIWVAPKFRQHRVWSDGIKAVITKEFAGHQFMLANAQLREPDKTEGFVTLWASELEPIMRLYESKLGVEPCLGALAEYGWMWRPGDVFVAGEYEDGSEANALMESVREQSNGDIIALVYANEQQRLNDHQTALAALRAQGVDFFALGANEPDSPGG